MVDKRKMSGGQNPAGEVSAGVLSAIFPDCPVGQGEDGPATVVHHGRVRAVLEEELHHPQVATLCGQEEGGPPVHIPRLEVDIWLVEEESHHPLPATPGSLHQRGPAVPSWALGLTPWASKAWTRSRLPYRFTLRSWVWHRGQMG